MLNKTLLKLACDYSLQAYNEKIPNAIKIESKFTSTTAFFIEGNGTLPDILCFRGTAEKLDWVTDAMVFPVPYAGRLCHGGFVASHASVWGKIKKLIRMDQPTLICGHSLGGGLAELTAAKLHKKHDALSLCTFGKPNTFFKGFKRPMKLLDQISCVSGSDIVARIPRYCYGPSVSQTILYHANNQKDYIDPTKDLKREDFLAGKTEMFSDHFMREYQSRLTRYLSTSKKKKGKKNAIIDNT